MLEVPACGGPPGVMLGLFGDPTELCVLGWSMLVLPVPIPVPVPKACPVGLPTLLLLPKFETEPVPPVPVLCELRPPVVPALPRTPPPEPAEEPAEPDPPAPEDAPPIPPAPPAPEPPAPPPAWATAAETGAAARISETAKVHALFNIEMLSLVSRTIATTGRNANQAAPVTAVAESSDAAFGKPCMLRGDVYDNQRPAITL